MASRRDVELVIRAKNEASKAVDQVNAALKELTNIQENLGKSGKSADSTLSRLGSTVGALSRSLAGIDEFGKVAAQVDKATAAVGKLEKELADTQGKITSLNGELSKTSANLGEYKQKLDSSTAAQAKQQAELKKSSAALTTINREVKAAQTAYNRLNERVQAALEPTEKLTKQFVEQTAKLALLKQQQEQQAAAVQRQKSVVAATKAEVIGLQSAVTTAANAEKALSTQVTKTNGDLSAQKTNLVEAKVAFDQLSESARRTQASISGITSGGTRADLERMATTLQNIARFSTGAGFNADPKVASALRAQREEVEQAKRRFEELKVATNEAFNVMRTAGSAATAEMTQKFNTLKQAVAAARGELGKQNEALARLQGSSTSSFAAFSAGVRKAGGDTARLTQEFNRASSTAARLKAETRQVGEAAAAAGARMRGMFAGFGGEGRQSLSLLQRLRGEFLALTASAVGFYGAIQQFGNVITSFQTLEAAQNRLGAVFGQDMTRVGVEIDFINRNASRLGISFGVLSDEYSKFAIASSVANFSSDETRKIFLSVAEAGRVNKLSLENMSGIFLALTQMMSKGKVTSEELRRQLGDRLPGAFNIMASALGLTTAELDKMMQQGDILADRTNMLKFADELTKRFGSQLPTALVSTTTEIGKFQNELFNAQLRVAQGGFIEEFTKALARLNEVMRSREGRDFFLSLGAAAGKFIQILQVGFDNMDLITGVLTAWIGLKLASSVLGWAGAFKTWFGAIGQANAALGTSATRIANYSALKTSLAASIGSARAAVAGFNGALLTTGASLITATGRTAAWRGALGLLGAALVTTANLARGLWMAVGGLPGVIITGLTFLIGSYLGSWLTGVDDATRAIDEHKRIMDSLLTAYDEAGKKTGDWAKSLKDVSADQVSSNLRRQIDEYRKAVQAVSDIQPPFNEVFWDIAAYRQIDAIKALRSEMSNGKISATEFTEAVEGLYGEIENDAVRKFAENNLEAARSAQEAEQRVREAAAAAKEYNIESADLAKVLDTTSDSMATVSGAADDNVDSMARAAEEAGKYSDALNVLISKVPELAAEMKRLGEVEAINAATATALSNPNATDAERANIRSTSARALALIDEQAFAALTNEISGGSKVTRRLVDLIIKEEGFRTNAYKDGMRNGQQLYSVGYGFQTVNGVQTNASTTIDQSTANRELVRKLAVLNAQIDALVNVPITDNMRTALASYAYNAGVGALRRDGIVQPLNRGDYAGAENAIRNGVVTSAGKVLPVLQRRRQAEADIFGQGSADSPEVQARLVQLDAQRAESAERYNEGLAQRSELLRDQVANEGQISREAFIQRETQKEIDAAKKAGVELTPQQISDLQALNGQMFDLRDKTRETRDANRENRDAVKEANLASQEANALLQMRSEIQRQIALAEQEGDLTKQDELKLKLEEVNAKLEEAIQKARAMWEALGGPQADVALTKLDTAAMKTERLGQKSNDTGNQIANMLAGGLTNMFDKFAQAVANGEDAVGALRDAFLQFAADFLRQIAQMIIQKAILNMLSSFGLGTGSPGGILGGLLHSGGLAGSSNRSRRVSPGIFANAVRYHGGGIAGLKPNEVPAILERGEEILTKDDPRHMMNGSVGGGESNVNVPVKIVNTFDAASFMEAGLQTAVGEKSILNFIRANSGAVKSALGN